MTTSIAQDLFPLYKDARAWLVQQREDYARECAEYAKQGLRPQYCRHGVNQWVDYDCACFKCELDEELPDAVQAHLMAKQELSRQRRESLIH